MSEDSVIPEIRTGVLLCRILELLAPGMYLTSGWFRLTSFSSGTKFIGVNRRAVSKPSACSNIEKALSVIWKRGVRATVFAVVLCISCSQCICVSIRSRQRHCCCGCCCVCKSRILCVCVHCVWPSLVILSSRLVLKSFSLFFLVSSFSRFCSCRRVCPLHKRYSRAMCRKSVCC